MITGNAFSNRIDSHFFAVINIVRNLFTNTLPNGEIW